MTKARIGILVAVVAAAAVAVGLQQRRAGEAVPVRLAWVATAGQFGPVGYRDPVGVLSPDGRWLAYAEGRFLRVAAIGGGPVVSFPPGEVQVRDIAWSPDNRNVYGPLAFSPDGATVYAASPNASATMDLWAIPAAGGRARRLTSFSRDSYAPSVAADGAVVFKVQSYRTVVAVMPAEGGPSRTLAAFQSETPSWDPTGRWISYHGTHLAARGGRREVSGHRAGGRHHQRGRRGAGGGARTRRAGFRVGGSVALLVAERQMDRVPFAQGSI